MKIQPIAILTLAATFALPQIAGANLTITPQALGFVESTLDYCAKVDSESASKYAERKKAFVADATKEELDKARSDSEYLEAYDTNTTNLEKAPKDQAVKSCKDFLEGK
jgi:hypothetical protein